VLDSHHDGVNGNERRDEAFEVGVVDEIEHLASPAGRWLDSLDQLFGKP